MGFAGGNKLGIDSEMDIQRIRREPKSATCCKRNGLRNFGKAKKILVEASSSLFAIGGNRDHDVMEDGRIIVDQQLEAAVVREAGFEPATPGSEDQCSIH